MKSLNVSQLLSTSYVKAVNSIFIATYSRAELSSGSLLCIDSDIAMATRHPTELGVLVKYVKDGAAFDVVLNVEKLRDILRNPRHPHEHRFVKYVERSLHVGNVEDVLEYTDALYQVQQIMYEPQSMELHRVALGLGINDTSYIPELSAEYLNAFLKYKQSKK